MMMMDNDVDDNDCLCRLKQGGNYDCKDEYKHDGKILFLHNPLNNEMN